MTSRIPKVQKIPIDQLISGAVKQYIDYVKIDNNNTNNQTEEKLLPLLPGTSEENSSSEEEKYKTIDTNLNGRIFI